MRGLKTTAWICASPHLELAAARALGFRCIWVDQGAGRKPLPSYTKAPELNPVENNWQFMRNNWLSNRVFASLRHIVDLCTQAWNNLGA